jgi:hypothetical protein
MDELPVFDEFFVYDEEQLQTVFDISTRLAGLVTQITSKPRKLTITCVKGKTTLKVTNVRPSCPTGYKQK